MSERRPTPRRRTGRLWPLLAALACAGCSMFARLESEYPPPPDPEVREHLSPDERTEILRVRSLVDAGAFDAARGRVNSLVAGRPQSVLLGILEQEVELAAGVGQEALLRRYWERAETDETPSHLVLVVRLEPDPETARGLLERAFEIDPDFVWSHYASAHLEARSGNWSEAREALDVALSIDPGHAASRRLEAKLLVRSGQRSEAIDALRTWLAVTEGDERIDPEARVEAQLDLALLWVYGGESKKARELLEAMGEEDREAARRLCILAGAHQALSDYDDALSAARAAEEAAPTDALAKVQVALLHESLDDPVEARRAWERVLSESSGQGDLATLIQRLRARIVLERWDYPPSMGSGDERGERAP